MIILSCLFYLNGIILAELKLYMHDFYLSRMLTLQLTTPGSREETWKIKSYIFINHLLLWRYSNVITVVADVNVRKTINVIIITLFIATVP